MDDLKILQKMYDFYLDNYNVINKYPKSEKFTLQTETKSTMLKMIRLIIRASKAKVKKPILFEIDTELETLRILFRLAHNLKFLSNRRGVRATTGGDGYRCGDLTIERLMTGDGLPAHYTINYSQLPISLQDHYLQH